MRTRAAVLHELHAPWSVEEIELDPPKAGEVLVSSRRPGMCHSDEHVVTGDLAGASPRPPMIGGHEGAGVVVEVGEGVDWLEPGDHVVFGFVPAAGAAHVRHRVTPTCATTPPRSRPAGRSATAPPATTRSMAGPRADVPARHVRRAHRRARVELRQDRQGLAARQGVPARLRRRDRLGLGGLRRRRPARRVRRRRRHRRHRRQRPAGRPDGRRPGDRGHRPARLQARHGEAVRCHAHLQVDRRGTGEARRVDLGPRLRRHHHDDGRRQRRGARQGVLARAPSGRASSSPTSTRRASSRSRSRVRC